MYHSWGYFLIWKMLPELLLHPHEAAASAPVPHIGHHQHVPLLRQVLGLLRAMSVI